MVGEWGWGLGWGGVVGGVASGARWGWRTSVSSRWPRGGRCRTSSPPLRGAPRRTRHGRADRTQPRPDPVPDLVPDPGRAVLAVSAPAAALAAEALRPRQPGAGGRRVHGLAVLEIGRANV